MTELEKIAYAGAFLNHLANGVNPLDGTPIPEGDLAANERLSRCFSYVSEVLGQIVENEKRREEKRKQPKRKPFTITKEQLKDFQYSEEAITLSAFCRRLEALVDLSKMKRISRTRLPLWLTHLGLLRESENAHGIANPTVEGMEIGIVQIVCTDARGSHIANALDLNAQRFVIDHIESFLAFR